MILVDTNVLVDIVSDDAIWGEWSQQQPIRAGARDDIVYAELSVLNGRRC